ncbi:hypothetical protein FRACYDRAFT_246893 [Fragilariopsis cylindrus CCMP1102]|uniref:Uncharacterized protein n=1 Tax=Fragilariopsis cylindrus CCMP1102 TaxID=635003 RepID=A0A1E7EWQ5_9STRA|nr:hypothetical protein FRACYDRAFT_246893 [Fragilariopsis cylindrus CCMP1102]|eukprot:OEU10468.1 hypothetical protein FRACYDRAFT_246893 [Fragilariopsis cylindrus CCMP1102]
MKDDASSNSTYYSVPSFLEENLAQQQQQSYKEFQNTLAIKLGHGSVGSKRWGHIKNITLKNGSSSVVDKDYRMGLISIAIVVIAIKKIISVFLKDSFIHSEKYTGMVVSLEETDLISPSPRSSLQNRAES